MIKFYEEAKQFTTEKQKLIEKLKSCFFEDLSTHLNNGIGEIYFSVLERKICDIKIKPVDSFLFFDEQHVERRYLGHLINISNYLNDVPGRIINEMFSDRTNIRISKESIEFRSI